LIFRGERLPETAFWQFLLFLTVLSFYVNLDVWFVGNRPSPKPLSFFCCFGSLFPSVFGLFHFSSPWARFASVLFFFAGTWVSFATSSPYCLATPPKRFFSLLFFSPLFSKLTVASPPSVVGPLVGPKTRISSARTFLFLFLLTVRNLESS